MSRSLLEQTHFCPWHEEDRIVPVLRIETEDPDMQGDLVCASCPDHPGESYHWDAEKDFCWCVK